MRRVAEPLALMGASVGRDDDGHAPVTVTGGSLHAIDYALPVPSAQVKSAILIAALHAQGTTCAHELAASRDHTERTAARARMHARGRRRRDPRVRAGAAARRTAARAR